MVVVYGVVGVEDGTPRSKVLVKSERLKPCLKKLGSIRGSPVWYQRNNLEVSLASP